MGNPIRMIEKQQRAYFKQTGAEKPIIDILKESSAKNFRPLFRGTIPLMGHSLASATTELALLKPLCRFPCSIRAESGAWTMQRRATNASDTAKERDFDYMAVCILVLYRKNIFLCLLPSLCVVSHDPSRVRDLG